MQEKAILCVRSSGRELENVIRMVETKPTGYQVFLRDLGNQTKRFGVNHVCLNSPQENMYQALGRNLVSNLLDGRNSESFDFPNYVYHNGTFLAIGGTGTGKTHTLVGSRKSFVDRGLIPRLLEDLFDRLEALTDHSFSLRVSAFGLSENKILDLLATKNSSCSTEAPTICQDPSGVFVKGINYYEVKELSNTLKLLYSSSANFAGHRVFTLHLRITDLTDSSAEMLFSKACFVELASVAEPTLLEQEQRPVTSAAIRRSVSTLENVLRVIAQGSSEHVPFRSCKLTHFLKDCLL
ncbi:Kinesin-like protein kif9, partial [Cichlidogyrus casuarinus]